MTSKRFKILALILLFIALTGYAYIKVNRFFDIDACLDSGNCWDYEKEKCGCIDNNYGLDLKVLEDPRFASGHDFVTRKPIRPKIFKFDNYTFVSGFPNDSVSASLGLFYNETEIFYETSYDGFYDTVMIANLNMDGTPDFLVSFAYEDGASLFGLLSSSKTTFSIKNLFDEWSDVYCLEGGDTLMKIIPLQIVDLNNDGKDDLIVNLVKINETVLSISCTDTVIAD
jgi:hypothetical protein